LGEVFFLRAGVGVGVQMIAIGAPRASSWLAQPRVSIDLESPHGASSFSLSLFVTANLGATTSVFFGIGPNLNVL